MQVKSTSIKGRELFKGDDGFDSLFLNAFALVEGLIRCGGISS